MAQTTLPLPPPLPLTTFTEDEILFRDNIRQFADEKVRPLVREMDEKGVFDKNLIHEFFQLGLMGIEIPEQYGGGGGHVFLGVQAGGGRAPVDGPACGNAAVWNNLGNNTSLTSVL